MSHPNWDRLSFDARYEMFDKLLDLEKEQIIDAYDKGSDVNDDLKPLYGTPEEYYNETYNK
jgi:hypothetical protein